MNHTKLRHRVGYRLLYLIMDNPEIIKKTSLWKSIKSMLCFFMGHKYFISRRISSTMRELKCSRCKSEFGMCDGTQSLLPLDDELKQLHNEILQDFS